MTASSVAPGTVPPLQLLGVPQAPPAGLTQVIVAGTVRSSSASNRGLNEFPGRRRGRGPDVGWALRTERRDMGRVSFGVTSRNGTIAPPSPARTLSAGARPGR